MFPFHVEMNLPHFHGTISSEAKLNVQLDSSRSFDRFIFVASAFKWNDDQLHWAFILQERASNFVISITSPVLVINTYPYIHTHTPSCTLT